jgi:chromate transporter
MLLIAMFFTDYKDNPTVEKIFRGIRPCVVALILSPAVKMCISAKVNWKTAIFPIGTALLIWWFKISPAYIIIFAIVVCLCHSLYIFKNIPNS